MTRRGGGAVRELATSPPLGGPAGPAGPERELGGAGAGHKSDLRTRQSLHKGRTPRFTPPIVRLVPDLRSPQPRPAPGTQASPAQAPQSLSALQDLARQSRGLRGRAPDLHTDSLKSFCFRRSCS